MIENDDRLALLGQSCSEVAEILRLSGVAVSARQQEMLVAYAGLLREWNSKVNLVSRKDLGQLWRNHILHSLAVLALVPFPQRMRCLDLGTGGGLPGVPLAIIMSEATFVLCDSIRKKILALVAMTSAIGLRNTECLTSRAEELARQRPQAFDVVLARAVAPLPDLARWAFPLLKPFEESRLVVWKGGEMSGEVEETLKAGYVRGVEEEGFERLCHPYFVEQQKKIITVSFRA